MSAIATRAIAVGLAVLAGGAVVAGSAAAATRDVPSQTSSNWAGYAVTGIDTSTTDPNTGEVTTTPSTTTFSTVSGAWTQPRAACSVGSRSYSAFWVGLGGFADGSQALEQIGTESDCTAGGRASYAVWYELVPDAPVTVNLKLFPGDTVSANVAVSGQSVTVKLKNVTRKKTFTRVLAMTATPDVSSAEWVAEAPSACLSSRGCFPLPLTNFGTVAFRTANATTSDGYTGTISDASFAPTAVLLQGGSGGFFSDRFGPMAVTADATPSALSSDGSSFSVSWAQSTGSGPVPAPLP
jgi:hypothetical protein